MIRDPELVDLLEDSETQFVEASSAPQDSALADLLRAQGLLRPQSLVVQSPYNPDRYVSVDTALEEFTIEKFLILTQLAQLLGAKRVVFEDARAGTAKVNATAEANGNGSVVSVESSVNRSLEDAIRQRLRGEHVFGGSAADVEGARKFLAENQVAGDPQLLALIDLRARANDLVSQDIRFNGLRESAGVLAAALRVAGGKGKLKLAGVSSGVRDSWQTTSKVEVQTRIEF